MGGLLHKGAIFSSLFFLLLYSDVWTTGSPHLHPKMHQRPEAGSALPFLSMGKLRHRVTKASGRSAVVAAERKRTAGEREKLEREE